MDFILTYLFSALCMSFLQLPVLVQVVPLGEVLTLSDRMGSQGCILFQTFPSQRGHLLLLGVGWVVPPYRCQSLLLISPGILLIFPCSTSATYAGKLVSSEVPGGDPTASSCSVAVTRVAPSVLIFFQQ